MRRGDGRRRRLGDRGGDVVQPGVGAHALGRIPLAHGVRAQRGGGIDEPLLLGEVGERSGHGGEVCLAAEGEGGGAARSAGGAVAAFADLHVDASRGEEDGDGGADGDAHDDGGGEGARARVRVGAASGGWEDDVDGVAGEDGVAQTDGDSVCGLLLAASLDGRED